MTSSDNPYGRHCPAAVQCVRATYYCEYPGCERTFSSKEDVKKHASAHGLKITTYPRIKLNVLLYGASGLGKTSCTHFLSNNFDYTKKDIIVDSTLDIITKNVELPANDLNQIIELCFTDCPGYGSDWFMQRSVNRVLEHIESVDNPFHLCLFFLGPQRIKSSDFDVLKELVQYVPVVLILSRFDSYTEAESNQYIVEVKKKLHELELLPVAIDRITTLAYNDFFRIIDRERHYPWGLARLSFFDNQKLKDWIGSDYETFNKMAQMRHRAIKNRSSWEKRVIQWRRDLCKSEFQAKLIFYGVLIIIFFIYINFCFRLLNK
jgi:GTPase SAR1 family protein